MTEQYKLPTRANPEVPPETDEAGEHTVGWSKGRASDGRPYWAECWSQEGITMLTVFLSSKDLEFGEDRPLQNDWPGNKIIVGDEKAASDYLEMEGLVKFGDKRFVTPCRYSDDNGEFWSINIVVGDDNETYCDSQFSIFPYDKKEME